MVITEAERLENMSRRAREAIALRKASIKNNPKGYTKLKGSKNGKRD